jgi:hypothetical protein
MQHLQSFYDEHAQQARQHEDQRERATNILLSIAGILVGLITFADLSMSSLAASLTLIALGIFGFFFNGKHYERFKFHTAIMACVRAEIDELSANPGKTAAKLSDLRRQGEASHYMTFSWPGFHGSSSDLQGKAKSWIARQRVHVFWETIPLLIAVLGSALTIAIAAKGLSPKPVPPDAVNVRIVSNVSMETKNPAGDRLVRCVTSARFCSSSSS